MWTAPRPPAPRSKDPNDSMNVVFFKVWGKKVIAPCWRQLTRRYLSPKAHCCIQWRTVLFVQPTRIILPLKNIHNSRVSRGILKQYRNGSLSLSDRNHKSRELGTTVGPTPRLAISFQWCQFHLTVQAHRVLYNRARSAHYGEKNYMQVLRLQKLNLESKKHFIVLSLAMPGGG